MTLGFIAVALAAGAIIFLCYPRKAPHRPLMIADKRKVSPLSREQQERIGRQTKELIDETLRKAPKPVKEAPKKDSRRGPFA